jgi:hypothetical protein
MLDVIVMYALINSVYQMYFTGNYTLAKSPKNNNITTYEISLTRKARPKKKNNRAMHTLKRTYNNLKIIKILAINMASHTHSGTSCGINRNHHGYVHKLVCIALLFFFLCLALLVRLILYVVMLLFFGDLADCFVKHYTQCIITREIHLIHTIY